MNLKCEFSCLYLACFFYSLTLFQRDFVFGFSLLLSSFHQDFGEYQESYYSVQTTEGEQISQLIAGYIDIILKKVR